MKTLSAFVNLLKNKDGDGGMSRRKERQERGDSNLPRLYTSQSRILAAPPPRAPSKSRGSISSLRSSRSVPAFHNGPPQRKVSPLYKVNIPTESRGELGTSGTPSSPKKLSSSRQKRSATGPFDDVRSKSRPSPRSSLNDTLAINADVDYVRSSHLGTFTPGPSPLVERPAIPIIVLHEDEDDLYSSRCILGSTPSASYPRPSLYEADFQPSFLDLSGGSENDEYDDWNYYDEELGVETMDAHCNVRKSKLRRRRRISAIPPVPPIPPPTPPVNDPAPSSKPNPKPSEQTRVLLEMFPDVPPLPKSDRRRPSTSPARHLPFTPKRYPSAMGSTSNGQQLRPLRRSTSADTLVVFGGMRRQNISSLSGESGHWSRPLPTLPMGGATENNADGRRSSNRSSPHL
ncbi:hypothetical protein NEOLEDRAFT_1245027 [Neolentinus lepideus HHB14362 ss-1]|uniref:Uncharacterized protein n=1 Tax=Neolentinus lepideus HHB14362 ss-1 TaxID=1314782 RepID=A0A165PC28_9AGAM|nr:hypothetical protein NEOLEDRAFT_1245027 [Neolentinus lepideus HHB14362 ss-1]